MIVYLHRREYSRAWTRSQRQAASEKGRPPPQLLLRQRPGHALNLPTQERHMVVQNMMRPEVAVNAIPIPAVSTSGPLLRPAHTLEIHRRM